jgi:hypothetical protein
MSPRASPAARGDVPPVRDLVARRPEEVNSPPLAYALFAPFATDVGTLDIVVS